MKKSHARAISIAKRASWQKGGASRIAYEKRRRTARKAMKAKTR